MLITFGPLLPCFSLLNVNYSLFSHHTFYLLIIFDRFSYLCIWKTSW